MSKETGDFNKFLEVLTTGLSDEEVRGLAWHDFNNIITALSLLFLEGVVELPYNGRFKNLEIFLNFLKVLENIQVNPECIDDEGYRRSLLFAERLRDLLISNNFAFAKMLYFLAKSIEERNFYPDLLSLRIDVIELVSCFVGEKAKVKSREWKLGFAEVVAVFNSLYNARNAALSANGQLEVEILEDKIVIKNDSRFSLPEDFGEEVIRSGRLRFGLYLARQFADLVGVSLKYIQQEVKEDYSITTIVSFPNRSEN